MLIRFFLLYRNNIVNVYMAYYKMYTTEASTIYMLWALRDYIVYHPKLEEFQIMNI